jgi:DNA-binding response OmpR family regulator
MASLPILVVTDDQHVRAEVVDAFPSDLLVKLAADSREASRLMERLTPALVIVDLRTGSAGGYGLVRDMAQDGRLNDVPVMMLLERPQDAWLAKTAGASLIRTKPISTEQLIRDARSLIPSAAASA